MYATIEPRLIALLNNAEPSNSTSNFDDSRPHSPSSSLELPPLQDPNILKANGRPLLLEPDASTRNGNPSPSSNPQRASLTNLIDEGDKAHNEGNGNQNQERRTTERALGISSPQSLRKILGEDVIVSTGVVTNKRSAGDNKDDFVQLPQPPKKRKTVKQVVPPIIIGLFEPPPQAALFPPIASSSFHDRHGRNTLNTTNGPPNVKKKELEESHKDVPLQEPEEKNEGGQEIKRKKTVRARKKWTEEETSTLLLGVNKHGIGSWADILKDPSFSFNSRSATDLKDRFRTCCPAELRVKKPGSEPGPTKDKTNVSAKSKTGLLSENILISEEDLEYNNLPSGDCSTPKKPRAHRRKVEDLAQLGIEGPFKKSLRRERTKFSEEEDREILQGYQLHGPAWSRIQRDPQFHLQSRKPTDLRDRFRNRYPDKWDLAKTSNLAKETESPAIDDNSSTSDRKGKENSDPNPTTPVGVSQSQQSFSLSSQKPDPRSLNAVLNQVGVQSMAHKSTPSSNREGLRIDEIISPDREISRGLPLQLQTSLFGLKDTFSSFVEAPIIETAEASDALPFTQSFDWGESTAAPFSGNMGEMDISRILDDAWIDNPTISSAKEKTSATDLNHIVSAHGYAPSGSTSYFNLICDSEEHIVDLQDEAPFG